MSEAECVKNVFDLYKDTEYRSFSQIFRFEACAAGASMASFRSGTEAGDAEPVRGIGAEGRSFPHPECGVFPHFSDSVLSFSTLLHSLFVDQNFRNLS